MLRFDLCDFFKDQPQDWEQSLLRCGVKESRSFPGCGRKVLIKPLCVYAQLTGQLTVGSRKETITALPRTVRLCVLG